MARINDDKSKAHTREEFIDYFDLHVGKYERGEEPSYKVDVTKWGMETYRTIKGQCMGCGCPGDNKNMQNSTSPYYCLICEKRMLGEEVYNRKQQKLNDWEDKTQGMTLKEKLKQVKKSLMFG